MGEFAGSNGAATAGSGGTPAPPDGTPAVSAATPDDRPPGPGATIGDGLAAAVATDPTRPLLTWYDDATGDRTELSGATLANWVAKTANLLVDGGGLGPGDTAGVLLPPHWQSAAVLLGCWAAGVTVVTTDPAGDADSAGASRGEGRDAPLQGVDVLFAAVDRVGQAARWPAGERYALGLAPLAAPLRAVPEGFADYVVEVRGHGDRFTPYTPVGPDDVARTLVTGPTATHRDLCQRALARAAQWGLGPRDRILIDAAASPDPVDWLLAPLLAGASVVLCGHLDAAKLAGRVTAERVTVTPASR
jgi:uncharacterized protein (TIGR03089 family)